MLRNKNKWKMPINQAILEGLRNAMAKGETLQQAMVSFQNSGYPVHEIQEAARALQMEQARQKEIEQQTQASRGGRNILGERKQPHSQPPPQHSQQTQPKPKHISKKPAKKVSSYESKKPNQRGSGKRLILIVILIFVFLALIGALVGVFIFKDAIVEFFNNVFGR